MDNYCHFPHQLITTNIAHDIALQWTKPYCTKQNYNEQNHIALTILRGFRLAGHGCLCCHNVRTKKVAEEMKHLSRLFYLIRQ